MDPSQLGHDTCQEVSDHHHHQYHHHHHHHHHEHPYPRSKEEETVNSDQKILIAALTEFQTKLEKVDTYDHIVFPPVYKQVCVIDSFLSHHMYFFKVVNFAIYIYFGLSLIGEQELKDTPELLPYFPSFLVLKFIFFFGWKEVAIIVDYKSKQKLFMCRLPMLLTIPLEMMKTTFKSVT